MSRPLAAGEVEVTARDKRPWFTEADVDYYAEFLTGPTEEVQHSLRTLLATVSEILGETDLEALLRKLVEHAIETTRAERGILLLREEGTLRVRLALDRDGRDLGVQPPMSRTIPQKVLREGRPVIARVSTDHQVLDLSQSAAALRLRQLMCAPLRARGETIGTIYVDSTLSGTPHTDADLAIFHAQAGLMGLAIENHRLFRVAWEARDVQQQLAVARHIQQRLFPESPAAFGRTEVAGLSLISAQVGGDYFDYLPLDHERVALCIGDVSGHGVAPALVMSDVRGYLRSLLQTRGVLDGVYATMNEALRDELHEGMFVALFVAVHDPARGVLAYQNAGHAAPILYRPATDTFQEIPPSGPALGLFDEVRAEPCPTLPVQENDCLVCYTDGVTDRPNPAGELYGAERLKQSLRRALRAGASVAEVAEAVRSDSGAHAGGRPLRDDFTLLIARF
ncbi:MAG: PP2C family protein-serine/threonine phosphatase [Planctomycetota bacterium]|jgi:sigma-B regulation protein RsbU (phosphoserine phosphatase)